MTLNKYHLGIRIHCMLDGTGQKRLLLTYALILFEKLVLEVGLNEVNLLTIAKLLWTVVDITECPILASSIRHNTASPSNHFCLILL